MTLNLGEKNQDPSHFIPTFPDALKLQLFVVSLLLGTHAFPSKFSQFLDQKLCLLKKCYISSLRFNKRQDFFFFLIGYLRPQKFHVIRFKALP